MERNHTKPQQDFFYIIHHPFSFTLLNIWASCGLPLWKIVKSVFLSKGLIRDWSLLRMLCFCIWQLTQKRKAIHKKEKQKEMEGTIPKPSKIFFILFTTPFSFTLLNIWTSCGLPLWKIVKSLFLLKGLIRDWSLLRMLCFCIWHPTQKSKAIHKKEKQKEMERNPKILQQ